LFVLKFYNTLFRTDRLRAEIAQATAGDIEGWRGRSDQIVVVIGVFLSHADIQLVDATKLL
jgi:hypothetical protein